MRRIWARFFLVVAAGVLASCGGGQPSEKAPAAQSGKSDAASLQSCVGITPADAAPFLGIPAAQITAKIEESHKGFWLCSFSRPDGSASVSFSVEIARSEKEAAGDMEEYRNNLEIAGE